MVLRSSLALDLDKPPPIRLVGVFLTGDPPRAETGGSRYDMEAEVGSNGLEKLMPLVALLRGGGPRPGLRFVGVKSRNGGRVGGTIVPVTARPMPALLLDPALRGGESRRIRFVSLRKVGDKSISSSSSLALILALSPKLDVSSRSFLLGLAGVPNKEAMGLYSIDFRPPNSDDSEPERGRPVGRGPSWPPTEDTGRSYGFCKACTLELFNGLTGPASCFEEDDEGRVTVGGIGILSETCHLPP